MNNGNSKNLENKKKIIATHSGNFHTDEVFASAVLSLLHNGSVEVVRSRDPLVWATGDYVVDVGGEYDISRGRFDHHQIGGAGARENGVPYSSFGLVWKEYGEILCGNTQSVKRIDEKLVQPVDMADNGVDSFALTANGVFPYLLHHVITSFRPTWKEESEHRMTFDQGFGHAMGIAREVLLREIVIARDGIEGEQAVIDCYNRAEDKRIIVIDGQYPWEWILTQFPEPLYIIKPDHENGGKWKVKTVRNTVDSFESRKLLPEAWAGKIGQEFVGVTGVADAFFCHNKRFIAGAGSKEGALKLAQLAAEA